MPFTQTPVPLLSAQGASPYAGLIQNMLNSYMGGVQARYAPQQQQADIFSKQFAPLAQIASSPLAQAMLPDQRQQMATLISQLLQQSGAGMPRAMGGGSSAIGTVGSSGTNISAGTPNIGNVGVNQGASSPNTGGGNPTPGLPSSDFSQAVAQQATAKFNQQLNEPGQTVRTSLGDISTPTSGTVNQAQDTLNSVANLKALLPSYLNQAQEFTTPQGSTLNRMRSGAAAMAQRHGLPDYVVKTISSDPDLAGRWDNFQSEKNKIGVLLQHIYPTSLGAESYKTHADMLTLSPTDTYNSFSKKVAQATSDLDLAAKNAKQAANAGTSYNLNPESSTIYGVGSQGGFANSEPQAQSGNTISLEGGIIVPASFPTPDAFANWFNKQPKQTQLAYSDYIDKMEKQNKKQQGGKK